ncbi:hypothetical protein L228DRAFT_60119 [Xylona heveae TC161]|uniref:Uncharacterized protein n=1 Tax=Xylona heveae (strain CBS 132557 / TC161) TaxID=1328760 RepID=A0A165IK48_XYLHT|nr:hypothetical protein L228DRAFT_60119 [Xylona heveae TC161]KZF25009.1 hypothetical protein L228DRAFT_60119 [Xylona heveae TC161]
MIIGKEEIDSFGITVETNGNGLPRGKEIEKKRLNRVKKRKEKTWPADRKELSSPRGRYITLKAKQQRTAQKKKKKHLKQNESPHRARRKGKSHDNDND